MRIQHNIMAMNAYRNYNTNTSALSKNLEKLSSGYKINRAGDDAAGLAISEKMRAQITGLNAAQKNVKDGISLVKTAEGAMQEIHDMLNRMDYLATQSANGTYDDPVDRLNLQKEVDSLKSEINRIADSANFNGIKLLDGSLDIKGELSITTEAPKQVDHAGVDGITVDTPEQGGGTKGSFTIGVDKLFGADDKLTISWGSGSGFDAAKAADIEGGADTTALLADTSLGGTAGKAELTFGTDFEGLTTAEQAASIAEKLNTNDKITAQFDVRAEGNKVILTNKIEGNDQATVARVEAVAKDGTTANKQAALTTDAVTNQAAAAGTTPGHVVFADFFTTTGMEFEKGDVLTFKITDANGNDWTAKLELDSAIIGKDDAETHANIVKALNGTNGFDGIYFEANDKTAAAEEKIKFSDLFTAAADGAAAAGKPAGADLKLTAKDATGVFFQTTTAKPTITSSNKKVTYDSAAKATVTAATAGTAKAAIHTVKLDTATGDSNFSYGDKLTLAGKLSDGRDFSFDLVAGKDFDIGDNATASMGNIVAVLTDAKSKATVEVKDDKGNVEQVAMNKIFSGSASAAGSEIRVENDAGTLKFTSQVEGNVKNGYIDGTKVKLTPADKGALSTDLRNGVQKTAASSSVSFDALEEGATVTVGDKTYEFVTSADKATAGNTAVVVDDLTSGESIAKALASQLTKDAGDTDPAYKVEQDGSKVTITTTAKGSDVAAPVIEKVTPSHKDVAFELQPNKLKAGSTITVNGKTFEFIDKTKDPKAAAAEGNIAIDVDMVKGDKEAINQAMVDALAKEGFEARLEDGQVKVCNDGEEEIKVSFNNGEALTLQIGDTSDSFNQLSVSVGDMHTWGMKIDGIDISNQKNAQDAIDYIKDAINYVSGVRGDLGAIQNRLEHTAKNLSVMTENIQDAESTIRDTDIAEEMMAYTKNNILVQSAQAMLAQANAVPQGVLQLLG